MPHSHRRHPRVLCSLAIIRDPGESSPRSAIRSTAVFTVIREQKGGARFAVDHRAFDRTANRADILAGLAERIPKGATVIARASRTPQHYFRHAFANGGPCRRLTCNCFSEVARTSISCRWNARTACWKRLLPHIGSSEPVPVRTSFCDRAGHRTKHSAYGQASSGRSVRRTSEHRSLPHGRLGERSSGRAHSPSDEA